MRLRKKPKPEKLNLIPILDAVFIFIFFLLMSAQFVEIYEIGSDAPTTKTTNTKEDKDPLNLTIDIHRNKLVVLKGVHRKVIKTISLEKGEKNKKAHEKLQKLLIEIKQKNKEEKTVILRPGRNIPYDRIVKLMDTTRVYKKEKKKIKLFTQVVFEKR